MNEDQGIDLNEIIESILIRTWVSISRREGERRLIDLHWIGFLSRIVGPCVDSLQEVIFNQPQVEQSQLLIYEPKVQSHDNFTGKTQFTKVSAEKPREIPKVRKLT